MKLNNFTEKIKVHGHLSIYSNIKSICIFLNNKGIYLLVQIYRVSANVSYYNTILIISILRVK